jgi:hypothetical protein
MITQEELQEILDIVESISLNFSQPETLNTQIKAIGIAQKKLKVFRKKIVKTIQKINQSASQAIADDAVTVLSDFLGNRKFAGQMRASNRRAIQRSKQATRQPFINLKDTIDATIIKCDEMKLMVEEYNSDPEAFFAKMKEKQEQEALKLLRKQEEQQRLRLLKEEEEKASLRITAPKHFPSNRVKEVFLGILGFLISIIIFYIPYIGWLFAITCIYVSFPILKNGILGLGVLKGECPYCNSPVSAKVSEFAFSCSNCNKVIFMKNRKFYTKKAYQKNL